MRQLLCGRSLMAGRVLCQCFLPGAVLAGLSCLEEWAAVFKVLLLLLTGAARVPSHVGDGPGCGCDHKYQVTSKWVQIYKSLSFESKILPLAFPSTYQLPEVNHSWLVILEIVSWVLGACLWLQYLEGRAGGLGLQSQPQLHKELEPTLGYLDLTR